MQEEPTTPELQRRIVYALLQPVAAWCGRFRLPLSTLEQLARLAYYEDLRRRGGATQTEVAERFGKSLRTVVGIERQYRGDFLAPAHEEELARRVLETIASGELRAADVAAELDIDVGEARRALAGLVRTGHASRDGDGRYRRSQPFQSLVRDDLLARLAGLRHQLQVISATLDKRFFGRRGGKPAVARTLSFLATEEDARALADSLPRQLRVAAIDLEERALENGGHEQFGLTFALAPTRNDED